MLQAELARDQKSRPIWLSGDMEDSVIGLSRLGDIGA
jgi:hypothetical protein